MSRSLRANECQSQKNNNSKDFQHNFNISKQIHFSHRKLQTQKDAVYVYAHKRVLLFFLFTTSVSIDIQSWKNSKQFK